MTHKNSILEYTYIYLPKNIVIGQMFTDVKKKTQKKFDVTILTQVVIGILDLWNASTYLSISQKI